MTKVRLSLRSTRYYAWSHLSVLAGITLSVSVLVGALLVGDSVKYTLTQSALLRLGGACYALDTKGRYFPADLADRLQAETSVAVAPALLFRGVAIGPESRQVNSIQIVGVDERFRGLSSSLSDLGPLGAPILYRPRMAGSKSAQTWLGAGGPPPVEAIGAPAGTEVRQAAGGQGERLPDDGIALNAKLAAALGVKPGDSISIRFSRPSLLPQDAPLSSRKGDDTVRGTFTVVAIWGDEQSGRLSLSASQIIPVNAFVNLGSLQKLAGLDGRANLLLAGEGDFDAALRKVWRLDDMGLAWRNTPAKALLQLESNRVMFDPEVGRVVAGLGDSAGALTYLVNSISRETMDGTTRPRSTPYSFVMAMAPSPELGLVPAGMKDDEILVNRWTADQLALRVGESVRVAYYEFTAWGKFVETSRVFRVCGIIPMESLIQERELAPRFPGLTDAGRCADWDIGMPLDSEKMEDKPNEGYWDEFRDTPKAFVTLKAGQAMWANRFGDLTAIRFRVGSTDTTALGAFLLKHLEPGELGFTFTPVRRLALKAAGEALDFGQLFLGMSGFVMISALMLTALLFSFSIQQRSRETGILLAVGFTPARVRWMLIREGLWVAGAGGVLGAGLGVLYTQALIWGLSHPWQGAVASTAIRFHAEPLTVLKGLGAGIAMALIALVVSTWRQTARPARELLAESEGRRLKAEVTMRKSNVILPFVGLAVAGVLVVFGFLKPQQNPAGLFFSAGSLLLISLLGFIRLYFIQLARGQGRFTLAALGVRNLGRRRTRSLTVVGLLASGGFMVFAVSSMQENIEKGASERSSGTGGFALYGESSIPILADLASPAGWKKLRLDQEPGLAGVELLPIKVRDGDDASCLNLNRAQSPRLLGVDPAALEAKGAFYPNGGTRFVASGDDRPRRSVALQSIWSLLREPLADGCVPGLAGDLNTAQWGVQKKVGDVLLFKDERGSVFKVKLVGALPMRVSVFQGSILISVAAFSERYPSESGARMILADSPKGKGQGAREGLARRLGKFGLNVIPTVDRLKEFHAVESTYLAMFLVLGGMGLLLGSAGMAIVVLRAIRERRSEFALLKAVGYSDRQVRRMIAGEHRLMLGLGLAAGVVSSLAAMWPNLHDPGVALPVTTMLAVLAGIILFHLLWIELAIRWACRTPLQDSLRNP
jgi:putative ABC transport system permease protein